MKKNLNVKSIKFRDLLYFISLFFLLYPLFFSSLAYKIIPSVTIRCLIPLIGMGG